MDVSDISLFAHSTCSKAEHEPQIGTQQDHFCKLPLQQPEKGQSSTAPTYKVLPGLINV